MLPHNGQYSAPAPPTHPGHPPAPPTAPHRAPPHPHRPLPRPLAAPPSLHRPLTPYPSPRGRCCALTASAALPHPPTHPGHPPAPPTAPHPPPPHPHRPLPRPLAAPPILDRPYHRPTGRSHAPSPPRRATMEHRESRRCSRRETSGRGLYGRKVSSLIRARGTLTAT